MSDDALNSVKSHFNQLTEMEKSIVTRTWTDFEKWVASIIAFVIGHAAWDSIKAFWQRIRG